MSDRPSATYPYQANTRIGPTMNPLDAMRGLTEPVWDRPTAERQLPKLGRGRPSREVQRERARLAKLGYLVPGTEEHAQDHTHQGAGERVGQLPPARAGEHESHDATVVAEAPESAALTTKQRMKYRQWAENMQTSIDRMTAAGAWHSVAYQTAKRDEWLRLAAEPPPLRGNG